MLLLFHNKSATGVLIGQDYMYMYVEGAVKFQCCSPANIPLQRRGVGSISILGPRVLEIMQYHIVDKKP